MLTLPENKKITPERIFSGHMKTSLEMHGFQICLLHLNQEHGDLWLELLDYPTSVLGWAGGPLSVKGDGGVGDDDTLLQAHSQKVDKLLNLILTKMCKVRTLIYVCIIIYTQFFKIWANFYRKWIEERLNWVVNKQFRPKKDKAQWQEINKFQITTGPKLSLKEQEIFRGCLETAAEEVAKNEGLLNRLDSGCGDGDCGNTLKKFGQGKTDSVGWSVDKINENFKNKNKGKVKGK